MHINTNALTSILHMCDDIRGYYCCLCWIWIFYLGKKCKCNVRFRLLLMTYVLIKIHFNLFCFYLKWKLLYVFVISDSNTILHCLFGLCLIIEIKQNHIDVIYYCLLWFGWCYKTAGLHEHSVERHVCHWKHEIRLYDKCKFVCKILEEFPWHSYSVFHKREICVNC